MKRYDVLIIGAGPAGKKVAAHLAERGNTVALVALPGEPETLQQRLMRILANPAWPLSSDQNCDGIANAINLSSKIDFYAAHCRFESAQEVRVGDQLLSAKRFVISSGLKEAVPTIQGLDQVSFHTPISLLSSRSQPASVALIGGGPIGVATASRLGAQPSRVTLFTDKKTILDKEDEFVSRKFASILQSAGVNLCCGTKIIQARTLPSGTVSLTLESTEGRSELTVHAVAIATGFTPNTRELNLKAAKVVTDENGWVVVNEEMRTSSPDKWAMGAVTGAKESFSLETFQAEMVAHNMTSPFFSRKKVEPDDLVLFTVPMMPCFSRIGLNEKDAREKYKDVVTSTLEDPAENRFIKLVGKRRGNELLGVHIIGAESDSIGLFFELAMRAGVAVSDLAETRFFPPMGTTKFVYESINEWMNASGQT